MLGRALRRVLPEADFVAREDGDLRHLEQARQIFQEHRPDILIHCAAKVGGVKENAERNADFFTENTLINTNVLTAAAESGVSRIITVLSTCAYQFFDDRHSTEEDLHSGMPYHGNLGYGYSKRALDVHCTLLGEQYGISAVTLTPATMFGPWDNFEEAGHVVSALIRRCLEEPELKVWGDGSAVRQFVFVDDVARIIAALLDRKESGNIVAVADQGVTIKQLAEAVASACTFSGAIRYDASQPSGVAKKVIASRRFSAILPDFRFTPIDEALRITADWYKQQRK